MNFRTCKFIRETHISKAEGALKYDGRTNPDIRQDCPDSDYWVQPRVSVNVILRSQFFYKNQKEIMTDHKSLKRSSFLRIYIAQQINEAIS